MSSLSRILYVDDESYMRQVGAVTLEKLGGYTVQACASGEEALEVVASFQPDLVLLDVIMPGMDGPATLKALRHMPDMGLLPVVFMTGKAEPEDIKVYQRMGISGVIAKPFDPASLPEQLETIWQQQ